jgi:sugar-phosphatase
VTAADLLARASGLLVDLDGTLVDSSPPVARVWSDFARRHRLDPEAVMRFAHGRPSRETVRLLVPAAPAGEEAGLEDAEVNDTDGVRALPGAAELLRIDRPLAIVTSCSRRLAQARLRAAGLGVPEEMVTVDDVERGKPDPEPFRLGASRLGLAPADCLVVEDSPAGVAAGRAAGAMVLAVTGTHGHDELREADVVVDSLLELGRPA